MNKIRAGIKNKIIVVLAVACTAYFVSFWMGTERDVALKAYEKAAEEAMIADTEILAHNGHIRSMDGQLLEMARVFRVPLGRRIRYIYLSQLLPFLRTAFSLSLGLCWKAGIAAEVIGIPDGSIGERLYESKVYLQTADLFAWTLVIVALSVGFEKCFLYAVDRAVSRLEQN